MVRALSSSSLSVSPSPSSPFLKKNNGVSFKKQQQREGAAQSSTARHAGAGVTSPSSASSSFASVVVAVVAGQHERVARNVVRSNSRRVGTSVPHRLTPSSASSSSRTTTRLTATAPDVDTGGPPSSSASSSSFASSSSSSSSSSLSLSLPSSPSARFELDDKGFAVAVDASSASASTMTMSTTFSSDGYAQRAQELAPLTPSSPSPLPPPPPPPASFEPQVDPAPAFASAVILSAFAVVNRRVAAAVDRRQEREAAEEALRRAKLRSLDGSADSREVSEACDALEKAREREAAAREVLEFFGADVRVRMPQPLGKPLSQVAEDEANVDEAIRRRKEARREREDGDGDGESGEESVAGEGVRASGKGSGREGGDGGDAGGSGGRFWDSVDADVGGEVRERWQARVENGGKRGETGGGGGGGGGGGEATGPPGWMTATVFTVLIMLTWSAFGLMFSADPAMGPALSPEDVAAQMAMR